MWLEALAIMNLLSLQNITSKNDACYDESNASQKEDFHINYATLPSMPAL